MVRLAVFQVELYRIERDLLTAGTAHVEIEGVCPYNLKFQLLIVLHHIECTAVTVGDPFCLFEDHFKQYGHILLFREGEPDCAQLFDLFFQKGDVVPHFGSGIFQDSVPVRRCQGFQSFTILFTHCIRTLVFEFKN